GRLRSAVGQRDPDQDVVGRGLGVLSEYIEVAVLVEDARVHELELKRILSTPAIFLDQPGIRILGLWILVQGFHVGVRGGRIEVVVELLDVFSVIALRPGQAEEPLFQNRIAAVPERQREAEATLAIGDAEQPVLAPAVDTAAGLVMRKILPAGPPGRIVLPDRAPLAFSEIGPPALPVRLPTGIFSQAAFLGGQRLLGSHQSASIELTQS